MGTLFIHAGHGKTGSSYLQNTFLVSHAHLAKESIYYSKNMSDADAESGVVTSGNARHCFESFEQLEEMFVNTPFDTDSMLLSSEFVFRHLPILIEADRKTGFERIKKLNHRFGFEKWKILLFIRDPIPFAVSAWLQSVKSHREKMPMEEFVLGWPSSYPRRVRGFIEICSEVNFIDMSVFNYSRIKNEIVQVAADWLGISRSNLICPKTRRVNRSLTVGESYVIAWLNRSDIQMRDHLGKVLVEKLPNIESDKFTLPSQVQRQFIEAIEEDMEYVANYVSDGHEYQFERLTDGDSAETHCFTSAQLDLILGYLIDKVSRKKMFRR